MEQRDYLKKQLDEFGQVLFALITNLLQHKNAGTFNEALHTTNQQLKEVLDYDLDELISIPDEAFIPTLKAKKIKNDGLDKLSDLLLLFADQEGPTEKGKKYYKKSLLLLDKLESVEAIYSMDRHRKIERVKKIMK
ncbi:MAG TPA: hypothetical protein VFF27_16510 [Bacteroidia bacterium]|jgi:hypothetical protein|nr:hypothetical protein [Bacteroidia bacterium]